MTKTFIYTGKTIRHITKTFMYAITTGGNTKRFFLEVQHVDDVIFVSVVLTYKGTLAHISDIIANKRAAISSFRKPCNQGIPKDFSMLSQSWHAWQL
jgi:hypothetical protein